MGKKIVNHLCELFRIGFYNDWSQTPPADFRGPFLCTLLGSLFAEHMLETPVSIYYDDDGCLNYVTAENKHFTFSRVQDSIVITGEGVSDLFLRRKNENTFSNAERIRVVANAVITREGKSSALA